MPAVIPEIIKSKVISQWLQGHWRDIIAEDNNISAGAVSNIIREWIQLFGKPEADAFRELAKSMNNAGLTPAQCVIGFRTTNWLSGHNMDAEVGTAIIRRYLQKM